MGRLVDGKYPFTFVCHDGLNRDLLLLECPKFGKPIMLKHLRRRQIFRVNHLCRNPLVFNAKIPVKQHPSPISGVSTVGIPS
jgi:hypothetical protein